VAGVPDSITGFAVDLSILDTLLQEEVVSRLDHQNLNFTVSEFEEGRSIPTTENLVIWIWRQIAPKVPARLIRLRLYEDPTLFVDYFGEVPPKDEGVSRLA
jgi:6-pyruvoyltetrahydropterin/6-carboxytetrahydropterin synthase